MPIPKEAGVHLCPNCGSKRLDELPAWAPSDYPKPIHCRNCGAVLDVTIHGVAPVAKKATKKKTTK